MDVLQFNAQLINSITVQTNPRPISIPAYTRGNSMDVVAVTFQCIYASDINNKHHLFNNNMNLNWLMEKS